MAPCGVLHAWATGVDDETADPTFDRVGKQKVENTGPLTRKRMETFDGEVLNNTLAWLDKNGKGEKPFFLWFNTTAMHVWSHPPRRNTCRWPWMLPVRPVSSQPRRHNPAPVPLTQEANSRRRHLGRRAGVPHSDCEGRSARHREMGSRSDTRGALEWATRAATFTSTPVNLIARNASRPTFDVQVPVSITS